MPRHRNTGGKGRKKSPGTKKGAKKQKKITKVRSGHFLVQRHAGKTRRRAVWVPKVLVDKNIIKVDKTVKFRKNKHGGKPL